MLLALHQAVVELILAVHHELSQLEQLGNAVLEALEAPTVNNHLAIGVGRTARTVGVWGGRLLLLSNLLLHGGSSGGLLVKGCQVWVHTADNLQVRMDLKLKCRRWNSRQEGKWHGQKRQDVWNLWVVEIRSTRLGSRQAGVARVGVVARRRRYLDGQSTC